MNIFRPQKRYVFYPPKETSKLKPFLLWLSERIMRRKFHVREVRMEGLEELARLAEAGHSLLVAPNHADHADPHVLLYAGEQKGLHFHFMAAREGFEKHRLYAFMLRRMGCFSVDREGADIAAVKTAMDIVARRRRPLVIFPEGEIYHHHERLDQLNEGVATILLRASAKVQDGRKCFMVPTAIRYLYHDEVAGTFSDRLDKLEIRIGWKPRPKLDPVSRIYRLGGGLLALKEEEFLGQAQTGKLVDRIDQLQDKLISMVEENHGKGKENMSIPERIRLLRGKIRKELSDEEHPPPADRAEELYDDLDTIFVAAQLYSYPGQYLSEDPSTNRIAETILKLEEDVLEDGTYPASMDVSVQFGTPVDVAAFLEERQLDTKTGAKAATEYLGSAIQTMLQQAP